MRGFLIIAAGVLAVLALAACGGSSATPTPSPAPTGSPAPPPLAVADDQALFRGVVTGVFDGRPVDGGLIVDIRVTDAQAGPLVPPVGSTARLFASCGFCVPCQGSWPEDIDVGYTVEVLAQWDVGALTLCPASELYGKPYGPTPSPTPRYTGPPMPITPTP